MVTISRPLKGDGTAWKYLVHGIAAEAGDIRLGG
jgi:hypothetical protein